MMTQHIHYLIDSSVGTSGKESACQCRGCKRRGLIPGSGRSPGGVNSNSLQYSCLDLDRGTQQATVPRVAVGHD